MFPSIAEGFGIPPIEAMHFGKPTFLSTRTSLPEIGGKYAFYFDDFDAENMQSVFEKGMNQYIEKKMSTPVMEHSRKSTWQQSANAFLALYKYVSYIYY